MDYKKTLLGALGGAIIFAGMGGKKGLEKGLSVGIKIGFVAGTSSALVGTQVYRICKNRAKEKMHLA